MREVKILCLADLHSQVSVLSRLDGFLLESLRQNSEFYPNEHIRLDQDRMLTGDEKNSVIRIHKFDLALFAGDLTNREKEALEFAQIFYKIIKKYGIPLFYIHGNNEPVEVIDFFKKNDCSLHYRVKEFNRYKFAGIGGYGELAEEEIERLKHFDVTDTILITHLSPKRKFYQNNLQKAPKIHLCGHRHENGSVWQLGKTTIVNIPPAEKSQAAILYLPSGDVKFTFFD